MDRNSYDITEFLHDYTADSPDKEIKIINAAINTFSEKGFEATRTKEIAERAGIAEGTIFRYFPTKSAILERMVPLLIRVMLPKISMPIDQIISDYNDAPVQAVFQAILLDRIQMIRDNERFIKSVLPELIHRAPLLKQMRESLLPMIEQYVTKVINYGKARSEIAPDLDPHMAMLQLLGFILSYTMFSSAPGRDETREVERFLEYVMKGWNDTCR